MWPQFIHSELYNKELIDNDWSEFSQNLRLVFLGNQLIKRFALKQSVDRTIDIWLLECNVQFSNNFSAWQLELLSQSIQLFVQLLLVIGTRIDQTAGTSGNGK
jgi:hypothetical protein